MHLCPMVVIYSTHALLQARICNLQHGYKKTKREEAILDVLAGWGGGGVGGEDRSLVLYE
jgi:hypothetical protein